MPGTPGAQLATAHSFQTAAFRLVHSIAFLRRPGSLNNMKQLVPAFLATLLLAGCVAPQVDWQARVGHYTHEQAIKDLGKPDKSKKLADDTVVDEWLTERSHVIVAPEPYFLERGNYFGPATPNYTETYVPNYFLRLTFGPDGKLRSWKRFAR